MSTYVDPIDGEKSDGIPYAEHDSEKAPHQAAAVPLYEDDPNLDPEHVGDYEEDSPYPEVRSAVANTDDPAMPVSTIRAWVLGLAWAILIPGLNQYVLV